MDEFLKRSKELLNGVDFKSGILEEKIEIDKEQEKLMEDIKKKDKPRDLALDDAEIYLKLAVICYSDGRYDEAEEWINKSLKVKNSYLGFLLKGRLYQKKNKYKRALGEYDEALKYNEEWILHRYRSQVLKERGKLKRALEAINKGLEKKYNSLMLAEKADILVDLGRIDQGIEVYREAEESDPELKNRERKITQLLEEAEEQVLPDNYNPILKLDKKNVEAWLGKAKCYEKINQVKKAKKTLEKALDHIEDERIFKNLEDYEKALQSPSECPKCDGDGSCTNCDGTGDCKNCGGTGNCKHCRGTSNCSDCLGSGRCQDCEGEGKTGWFSSECGTCSGTGLCQTCDGFGTCTNCEGTGACQICGGNKNCIECQGSGDCNRCEGRGTIGG